VRDFQRKESTSMLDAEIMMLVAVAHNNKFEIKLI
jgi:hypothetical protein